jgi:hypothetical protein
VPMPNAKDMLAPVVLVTQALAAVPTQALADRVIRSLTTAKLTNGIGRHYTVNRLRLSLYFQHSSTVVH